MTLAEALHLGLNPAGHPSTLKRRAFTLPVHGFEAGQDQRDAFRSF